MEIRVERKWKKETYTIGNLYIDGKFFCSTLEDKDRGLNQNMSINEIVRVKVPNETAIPTGIYNIDMSTISPKYSKYEWYKINCRGGRVPRLVKVPGFEGVLIHTGNWASDSAGCILVGKNDVVGGLTQSRNYFLKLYDEMYKASLRGERIDIIIE